MPFSFIQPLLVVGVVTAGIAGLYWIQDAIGDKREAQVRAEMTAKREAEKEAERQAVAKAGEEAENARRGAMVPGSIARLRAEWCRDCGGQP